MTKHKLLQQSIDTLNWERLELLYSFIENMKGPFISSGKARINSLKWMLFSFIVMLIAVSEANATTLFKVYPLADDYF